MMRAPGQPRAQHNSDPAPDDQTQITIPEQFPIVGTVTRLLDELVRYQTAYDRLSRAGRAEARTEILAELRDVITEEVRLSALRDIQDGDLSQKRAAEILGVHQATVGRWVKEDSPRRQPRNPSRPPIQKRPTQQPTGVNHHAPTDKTPEQST